GGEVIDHPHLMAAPDQELRQVRADEAGPTGDEHPHSALPTARRGADREAAFSPVATRPTTLARARRSQAITCWSSTRSVLRGSATTTTASARAARSIASPELRSAAPTCTEVTDPAWA